MARDDVLWEVQAPGWAPIPRWVIALGSLVAGGVVFTLRAEMLVYPLGVWKVPALLPLAVALFALGVYWLARWRSTTWSLTPDGLVRVRGVFWPRARPPVPVSEVEAHHFAGLSDASVATLVEAVRSGAAPAVTVTSRGSARPLLVLLVLSILSVAAVEVVAWRHRVLRAELSHLDTTVRDALYTARSRQEPVLREAFLQRIARDDSLRGSYGLARARSNPRIVGGVAESLHTDLSFGNASQLELRFVMRTLEVTRSTVSDNDVRVSLMFRSARPAWIPSGIDPLTIDVEPAPDNEQFLRVLLPLLDEAGVAYQVR